MFEKRMLSQMSSHQQLASEHDKLSAHTMHAPESNDMHNCLVGIEASWSERITELVKLSALQESVEGHDLSSVQDEIQ